MVCKCSLLLVVSLATACSVTQCVSDLPSGQCFKSAKQSLTYKIQSCPSGQKCAIDRTSSTMLYDFNQDYNCVSENWLPTKKFPGELCTSNEECYSNTCGAKKTCRGKPQGDVCASHEECDVGLVCIGGVSSFCTPQAPAGASCSIDDECTNDSLCYNTRCTLILSLPDGAVLQAPFSQNQLLCSSGFILDSRCSPAPRNQRASTSPCYGTKDCPTAFPDGVIGDSQCLCGLNTQGNSFCQAVPGDDEFEPFKAGLIAVRAANNKCHYSTSFSSRCPELSEDVNFAQFITAYYVYVYRHAIVGSPDCVQSIMPFSQSSNYLTTASDGSGSSDKTVIIIVVVVVFCFILLSGVVCFMCVRRCAMEENHQIAIRRRIMTQEMEQLEVRVGRVVRPTENTDPWVPVFRVDDLLLDQKDKHFIKLGIPLATEVNPRDFDEPQRPDFLSEIPTATALSPILNASTQVEATPLENADHPSSLFFRSKPNSSHLRT